MVVHVCNLQQVRWLENQKLTVIQDPMKRFEVAWAIGDPNSIPSPCKKILKNKNYHLVLHLNKTVLCTARVRQTQTREWDFQESIVTRSVMRLHLIIAR